MILIVRGINAGLAAEEDDVNNMNEGLEDLYISG